MSLRVAIEETDPEIALQVFSRKLSQCLFGLVFVLGHHNRHMFAAVRTEAERFSTKQLVAGDRATDKFLDMLDNQVGSAVVLDERRLLRVVHRIGQIPHEHHAFSVFGQLPQSEGPAEDAHVGVDAQYDYMLDTALFQEVPDFLAAVADRVLVANLQHIDLALPRRSGLRPSAANLRFHSLCSCGSSSSPPSD